MSEICTIYGRIGFRGYTQKDMVLKGQGAISLSPGNIQNNNLTFEDCKYISWEKYEESPEIKIHNGDVVFVKTGSTVGKVGFVKDLTEKATLNPQLVVFKNLKVTAKYLYYVLCKSEVQDRVKALAGVGSVPNISQSNIAKIEIPVPPIAEQKRIVTILDKFDALVNDISVGLPAEIEARRKQYEYYRNRLLTFNRLNLKTA